MMKIIGLNPIQRAEEHDKILRRLLAQRANEWRSKKGVRRLIARIKIQLWAWRETSRELERNHKKRSLYDL